MDQGIEAPTSTDSTPKRSKHRSCEQCRSLKIACVPSDQPGLCSKCQKNGKPCIITDRAPRSVKPGRTAKTRVSEVERKLDGLVAMLTERQNIISDNSNYDPSPPSASSEGNTFSASPELARGSSNDDPDFVIPCPRSGNHMQVDKSVGSDECDAVGRGLITLEDAKKYFDIFMSYGPRFPIFASHNYTFEKMRLEKPIVLLAILASTTYPERLLQLPLETELKRIIFERAFLKNDKTLTLLQAALVYAGWIHFHINPANNHLYQLINVAIGIVQDIGLDRRPYRSVSQKTGLNMATSHIQEELANKDPNDQEFWGLEGRRAFLGTWLISSSMAMNFRRKNLLYNHRNYVERCVTSIIIDAETPIDIFFANLVKSQILSEDIVTTFGYDDDIPAPLSDVQLQMNIRIFEQRLATLREEVRMIGGPLDLSLGATRMYLYEVGLYMQRGLDDNPKPLQTSILCSLLNAAYTFLDGVLSVPPYIDQRGFASFEWMRVTYTVVILSKITLNFASAIDPDNSSLSALKSTSNTFKNYLDALVTRANDLNFSDKKPNPDPSTHDVFYFMRWIFGTMRVWHETRMAKIATGPPVEDDEFSPLQTLPPHPGQDRSASMAKAGFNEPQTINQRMQSVVNNPEITDQNMQTQRNYGNENEEMMAFMQLLPGLLPMDGLWDSIMEDFPMALDNVNMLLGEGEVVVNEGYQEQRDLNDLSPGETISSSSSR